MSKISKIKSFECLDSRGYPTLCTTVTLSDGSSGIAFTPSGASTGEFEALELRDADAERYMGKGVLKAVENVNQDIAKCLTGMDILNLSAIDRKMLELDGTENKAKLGANAILSVSLAAAHAGANYLKIPLFQYLGGVNAKRLPVLLVNVLNGGAHAANTIDFQEFMLVPHTSTTVFENLRVASEIFHTLKKNLSKKGLSVGLGDEGGFAPDLANGKEALDCLMQAIADAGYEPGVDVSIALDCAASELYDKNLQKYVFKKSTKDRLSSTDLINLYSEWLDLYPIVSIEDGLDENDWDGWIDMTTKIGNRVQLVGDDLFVTNPKRLKTGIERGAANAILVKLNQIGTVSETLEACNLASQYAYRTIISHRSGETEDCTIADLSVATGSSQIKTGSVCRSERTAKYNRLLWIETFLAGESYVKNPFA